jgi:tetratricopeptide (TPR) repeat protein
MIEAPVLHLDYPLVTDGDIAAINLESALRYSWSQFWKNPQRSGIAERIIEQEQFTAQYIGDLGALDRLDAMVNELDRVSADGIRTTIIRAQVAAMAHRFADARDCLAQAALRGAPPAYTGRLSLSIDQACGTKLDAVLEARQGMAESGRLEDLVPLGGLLADLRDFDEADRIYERSLLEYTDVSPFAVAWVCFLRGVLWGELVPETRPSRAASWYRKAIEYLPCYVKARVHLSEIYLDEGKFAEAESLLIPAISIGDPEVNWRLANVMLAAGQYTDAEVQMQAAHSGFEILLNKHLLAFADHGAEFYSGSGNDPARAFELATVNFKNRPTLRAFEQAYETAIGAAETDAAQDITTLARKHWGGTPAFVLSPLAIAAAGAERPEKNNDQS